MPTRCNRCFYCSSYCLLNMFQAPLCLSSGAREYYTDGCCLWYLVLWFSSCWYGVELRVVCPVCGLLFIVLFINGNYYFRDITSHPAHRWITLSQKQCNRRYWLLRRKWASYIGRFCSLSNGKQLPTSFQTFWSWRWKQYAGSKRGQLFTSRKDVTSQYTRF